MRIVALTMILFLSACAIKSNSVTKNDPANHCPGFTNGTWVVDEIPEMQKSLLIDKQKFAIPDGYQTLWFRSESSGIGLCIIPDEANRGSRMGCGTAYAIFVEEQSAWRLKDQTATICSG